MDGELLGSIRASGHDTSSCGISSHKNSEGVGFLIAGAYVGVVLIDLFLDNSFFSKLFGSEVTGGDEVPEVVSERDEGTSSSVQGSHLVESHGGGGSLSSSRENKSSGGDSFRNDELESSGGHWYY